jgi:hypothetical protein
MRDGLLPLFPLSVVLLPSNELPLHIFEDRYKEMIGGVLRERSEFGVVLASSGGIAATGCTATVEQVIKEYEDGRMDIMTVGQRRFVIRSLDQELEYLRGEVEFFEDDDSSAPADLRRRAADLRAGLEPGEEPDTDDPLLSFQLARGIDDIALRQQLLMSRSEPERLRRLVEYLPAYSERQRQAERMRELAPKNGHGKLPETLKEDS